MKVAADLSGENEKETDIVLADSDTVVVENNDTESEEQETAMVLVDEEENVQPEMSAEQAAESDPIPIADS